MQLKAATELDNSNARPMSGLGQKQTFAVQNRMSALPPKAGMCGAKRDVRFGPAADIRLTSTSALTLGPSSNSTYRHSEA
jgi:hypothetical protein